MKKLSILTLNLILTSFVLLSACNNTSKQTQQFFEGIDSENSASTILENQEVGATLEGTLVEDAQKTDSSDESIRLFLKEIKEIEDPENFSAAMKNDGVVLNVPVEIISENISIKELKAGDKVQFELSTMPIMTASIPPQIAGNAIISVEKIK